MLYKLIFEFIIPVYNTTKQMKNKVNEMHRKMQDHQQANTKNFNATASEPTYKKPASEDYIDYEEIK